MLEFKSGRPAFERKHLDLPVAELQVLLGLIDQKTPLGEKSSRKLSSGTRPDRTGQKLVQVTAFMSGMLKVVVEDEEEEKNEASSMSMVKASRLPIVFST